jgi:hypothetical protein
VGEDLAAGIKAYREGEPDRAEKLLLALAPKLTAAQDLGQAWLYIGLAQASRGDIAAGRSFARALMNDPLVRPSRKRTPPPVLAQFNAAHNTITGELSVAPKEAGAVVQLDGVPLGAGPQRKRLKVGKYQVRVVSSDQNRMHETSIVVAHNQVFEPSIPHPLPARMGRVKLDVEPATAQVFAKDKPVQPAGDGTLTLPAGRYRLTFRAAGRLEASQEIIVEPEKTSMLQLRLDVAAKEPPRKSEGGKRPWYKRTRVWGYLALGLGVGIAGGGLGMQLSALGSEDEAKKVPNSSPAYTQHYNDAYSKQSKALIFFGVAGAAAATGLVLVLLGDKDTAPKRSSLRLVPNGAGLSLVARF